MQELFEGQNPKLVLFDLDGTLVHSVPDLAQAIDRMLVAIDRLPAGIDKVGQWVGNGAAVLVRRSLADDMAGEGVDESLFDKAYELFLAFYSESTSDLSELYPGVLECLEWMRERGVKLGVVTNKPISFTHSMLEGFGISDFFEVVLGGDSLSERKPHPMPLQEAMKRCGTEPQNTLMVGDSVNDVAAARAAGCPVVCVPYGYNHGEDIALSNPDKIVGRLDHLF